ncbi:NAD-dependent glycerol-3-phosphate dehydrogenase family protein [Bacillus cereus]|nr:NAD-dependent glycerol-3-phosphate dehydrogenase family protein [Bacillus cereus]
MAVWIGPGHVQDFVNDIPNCMVIGSENISITKKIVQEFNSDLIRFYYGQDLIGNEIGAATKNVMGIAAGMLDGLNYSSLKGSLMARGTRELSRLVTAMGGNDLTIYGLSHLGDYEATLFSLHSHNRKFGEAFVLGQKFDKLAEGVSTVKALKELSKQYDVELPISNALYEILFESKDAKDTLEELFLRPVKFEF